MAMTTETVWRSAIHEDKDQQEAWRERLCRVYDAWTLTGPAQAAFDVEILQRSIDSFQVIECRCDPCGGIRKRPGMSHDQPDQMAVQLVLGGREHFTIDGRGMVLGAGDVLIWNTTRPMRFEVVERLHKISVLMPLARLRQWLPGSWHAIDSRMPAGSAAAAVVADFIGMMAPAVLSGRVGRGDALTEAMLGVLVGALDAGHAACPPGGLREAQILRVKAHIERHLDDPALSPARIAAATGMSLRHLHGLFEPEGITLSQYVIAERLRRCRRDLASPVMAQRTITDIAFSWGFQNAAHFSRRFKAAYGTSPSDFRHSPHG
ncbi:AraC family transcriptional regulator [Tistrella bauzanensis]|uniref:AraC family transcriptional regulator n=1 Tax=Tistrella bauzanensis TaxID=657419 RepID=A0ABQ1I938_9PROT|nr:helix-turn-helix domain-containing protein [Tistrella bauzanensis]GGB29033.1 AraC family transcriptional regulator [Tistrella bauzanensis]